MIKTTMSNKLPRDLEQKMHMFGISPVLQDRLYLGNLGHIFAGVCAKDYVERIWLYHFEHLAIANSVQRSTCEFPQPSIELMSRSTSKWESWSQKTGQEPKSLARSLSPLARTSFVP